MRKNIRNKYSIDHLYYQIKQNFYLTLIFLFFTLGSMIAGIICLITNQNAYALGCFIVSVIYGLPLLYTFFCYLKFKRLIKKILDSLSEEEKNDVSFLMSIDCRDYLKKNYKETDENEDLDD